MRHATLIAALGVSVALHGAIVGGFDWVPVFIDDEPTAQAPLQAKLTALPARVPAPAAPSVPKPNRVQKKEVVAAAAPVPVLPPLDAVAEPAVEVPAPQAAADAAAAAEPPPAANEPVVPETAADDAAPEGAASAQGEVRESQAPSVDFSAWPARGEIRFEVALGDPGFVVGAARHEWSHDGSRYRMSVVLETTGVVSMFRDFHYTQRSEGQIDEHGLKPERFSVDQLGKKPVRAVFDWADGQVNMKRGSRERTAAIAPGDQDVLSLWHQIGAVGAVTPRAEVKVVSGREATLSTLETVGAERLRLPLGVLETERLRARAKDGRLSIDIWLARDYGLLPVRIRIVDDKGEVLDQRAVELRLAPPEAGPQDAAKSGNMIELRQEILTAEQTP